MTSRKHLENRFEALFGYHPALFVSAPGRVNLIGEHIDYNGGRVLPMAIGRRMYLCARPRHDGQYHLHSLQFDERYEGQLPDAAISGPSWANYIFGVIHQFKRRGVDVPGIDAVFDGEVPVGSGLSSSAAIEVAAAWFIRSVTRRDFTRMELAVICQRAENEFVGVHCGIMDQAASACGEQGKALALDCSTLRYEQIPIAFSDEPRFLVVHSGVYRGLDVSEYNRRRSECEEALRIINSHSDNGFRNLCAVPFQVINDLKGHLSDVLYRRALHAAGEERRVEIATEALKHGKADTFGQILNESHQSLAVNYEVSTPELDELTSWLRAYPGVYGSRLTGAGFGGCTISLVRADTTRRLLSDLEGFFTSLNKPTPLAFYTEPEAGVWSEPLVAEI